MKKDTLINGALIATASTIFVKLLGVFYSIPLERMIGSQGGALSGYGYTIYNSVATIAMIGIPLAVSKLIASYNAKGYYKTSQRVFSVGRKFLLLSGIVSFILMFILAEPLAYLILSEEAIKALQSGVGNTIADVVFVVRVMSITLIVVPYMSVMRGYLQGNDYISPTSYSQIVEQVIRILVILVGAYLTLFVFDLGLRVTVGVVQFGAFAGGVASLIYLNHVRHKHKAKFTSLVKYEEQDPEVSDYFLLKELIMYALPFMLIAMNRQFYNLINLFTFNRQLGSVGYLAVETEAMQAIITNYGLKLTAIITSVSAGFTVSLIPTITRSYMNNDQSGLINKINQIFSVLLFIVLPLATGIAMLGSEIYFGFFPSSFSILEYSGQIFSMLMLITIITTFANISTTILQVMNKFKFILISIAVGLIIKFTLNYPMILLLENLLRLGYQGPHVATILGYGTTMLMNLLYIHFVLKITLKDFVLKGLKVVLLTSMTLLIVYVIKVYIPIELNHSLYTLGYSAIVAVIAAGFYFVVADRIGLVDDIFGPELKKKFFGRFRRS